MASQQKARTSFGSKLGFILVTIGFSVGVGTLWRFPYICGEYGGGLFLLTYIIMMIVIGIPLFSAEMSLGIASQQSPVGAYEKLSNKKAWGLVGYFNIIACALVVGYTLPVYAWILNYIYATATGVFNGMDSTQVSDYFGTISSSLPGIFFWSAVNIALATLVVRRELQKGIEKISKIILPTLVIIMIAIIIMGLQFEGAMEGVKFFFVPDISSFSFESITVALGQTFFSLGVGMAVAVVFGSYHKPGSMNTVKSASIISGSVILVAIMTGLMIFPMVSAFGLSMAEGAGLTFVVMPNVFNGIAFGNFWGTLFYIAFYIAAFSSSTACYEALIGFFMDRFQLGRGKALLSTMAISLAVGIPAILSGDLFNLFDMLTNNVFLVLGAFFMAIFIGWFWGIDQFAKASGIEKYPVLTKVLGFVIRYVAPLIVVVFALDQFKII